MWKGGGDFRLPIKWQCSLDASDTGGISVYRVLSAAGSRYERSLDVVQPRKQEKRGFGHVVVIVRTIYCIYRPRLERLGGIHKEQQGVPRYILPQILM